MRLLFANERLLVAGRAYVGFPLVLDDQMRAVEPAQTFLWDFLRDGRRSSPSTWENYGRAIYDFFGYVLKNGIAWKTVPPLGLPNAVESYRDWSCGVVKLDPGTINKRLRVIARFYEWAKKKGYIEALPFERVTIQTSRSPGFLAHVDSRGGKVETPDFMLREKRLEVRFLHKEQVQVCRTHLTNLTHRLMFDLMVRTGLRQVECRTFPEKYVFDPSRRKDLDPKRMIRVTLNPRDMKTKFNNERDIDIPFSLMQELWDYTVRHRQKRERNEPDGKKFPILFLTEAGQIYTQDALTQMYRSLKRRVGFDVRPHMLRHTYATYLLWTLRKSTTFQGEPLLYVRDRMGHADISSTVKYLHLLNSLEGHLVLAHEDELDALFAVKAGEKDGI